MTGYESIRRLAHEHLLPALERFIVLASRLRGLSKYQVSNCNLGLSSQKLDNIIDIVSCLQLVAHRILIIVGTELRQFQAFSLWLRQEIDNQAPEQDSSENIESGANIDYISTLQYIQGAMSHSGLLRFLDIQGKLDQKDHRSLGAERESLFELYKLELEKQTGQDQTLKKLPYLGNLVEHLQVQCNQYFYSISEMQRRNVRIGGSIPLCNDIPEILDARICQEVGNLLNMHYHHLKLLQQPGNLTNFTQYVAVGPTSQNLRCKWLTHLISTKT